MKATIKELPAFTYLRTQFIYDQETGELKYRSIINEKRRCADQAGCIVNGSSGNQYRVVTVEYPSGKKETVFAHRAAWKLMTGEEPPIEIDHIDGDGLNNAWLNLRDGSEGINAKNRRMYNTNTSGVTGVSRSRGKWRARIALDGNQVSLGYFKDKSEAASVAKDERLKLGYTMRHGESKN